MKIFFLVLLAAAVLIPGIAFGGSFGIGPEADLDFFGNSQLQWSVVKGSSTATYALFGKQSVSLSPGLTFFYIFDKNVILGGTALYRNFPGEFQVPDNKPNLPVNFEEEALIFRVGYIDFYRDRTWHFSDFDAPVLPAFPFGHFRLGIYRSDISGSKDFKQFQPAYAGSLGIEMGAIFMPAEKFYFTLSGLVDYTFTVVPYKAHIAGVSHEILNNVLLFGISFQLGFLSDTPE